MKKFFSNITPKTFKVLTILICALGDFVIIAYLWDLFSDYELIEYGLKFGFPGHREFLDETFKRELYQLNLTALKIILPLYLIFHWFHFVCFWLNKKFAYVYLRVMVWVAGPGLILAGLTYAGKGNLVQHLLLPQGFLYIFIGMGMISFPYKKLGATKAA